VELHRAAKRLGDSLGHWHPHGLRHSAASTLLAQGVPLEVVSETLGHSSIRITKDVYGHLIGTQRQERRGDAPSPNGGPEDPNTRLLAVNWRNLRPFGGLVATKVLLRWGGPYRTRTCDPLRVMQVRYQLR
jgi:hypothetical protein